MDGAKAAIIPYTFANEHEAGWGKFTPKISLRYKPTSALNLYATVSQGFKSGGFAASPTSVAETNSLRPEQATNVELGAKMELSRRLQLNLALLDTRYGQTVDLRNQSGQNTFRAPRNKGSLEILHELPLGRHGELETSAGYNYTCQQRGELEHYAIQPAYGLIDGSLTWLSPGHGNEVSLWGKNLTNRDWISHVYTIANEFFGVYGNPRMNGLRLTWHFDPKGPTTR